MNLNNGSLIRYNLSLPGAVYEEFQTAAAARQITVLELLRDVIKLGLVALAIEEDPNTQIVIQREGEEDRVLTI